MRRKTEITEDQVLMIMEQYRLGIDSRETANIIGCSNSFISTIAKAFNGSKKKLDTLAKDHIDLIMRISPFYNHQSIKSPQETSAKENGNISINAIFDPEKMQLQSGGLTKREYFAGLAMQGLLTQGHWSSDEALYASSIELADKLLKQLEKTK